MRERAETVEEERNVACDEVAYGGSIFDERGDETSERDEETKSNSNTRKRTFLRSEREIMLGANSKLTIGMKREERSVAEMSHAGAAVFDVVLHRAGNDRVLTIGDGREHAVAAR